MRRQKNLFTGKTQGTARGQRGREFEAELDAVHKWYKLQAKLKMYHHGQEWAYISEFEYQRTIRTNPAILARTGDGRTMKRLKSIVDFTGGNDYKSFAFDAKEVQEKTFPLSMVHEHQVDSLNDATRCGMIAGVLVKFSEDDRVFFIFSSVLRDKYEGWKKQTGRAKPGTASFSIPELEQAGVEVFRDKMNMLWDWYSVLF